MDKEEQEIIKRLENEIMNKGTLKSMAILLEWQNYRIKMYKDIISNEESVLASLDKELSRTKK
jgi:hypothetical protein